MPKSARKSIISAGIDYHRKCHMAYVPRVIGVPKSRGPQNMRYEQYIEISDDSEQDTCNRKKDYIQQNLKIKNDRKTKYEKIREPAKEEVPAKPNIKCYTNRNSNNNPVIVDSDSKKSAAPIKKITLNIPAEDEKPLHEERMDWNNYHKLGVIHKFMDDLESDFPSLCTTSTIGTSLEGRNLKILKISNSNASNAAVWVDAGIHAREWIAPAVNTYIADHISRNFDSLPESIRNKDWYFLPVVNPDGYHYSHSTDRMWRKNRAWHSGQCVGVDLNRNFSVGWGGRGSSDNPQNAFFRGPHPFSEPESSAIRDMLLKSGIKFKVYLTLHSYGQVIIFPYACSSELASDYVRLLEGATVMSKAIYNVNGNTYKVGISRDVMYGAAGTSNDFAHAGAGIPYCYLIELRSKKHKFRLPKEEIEETGYEILSCVKALMEFVDTYSCKRKINSDQKDEKDESFLKRSTSGLHSASSNVRRRESYDKRSYSYIKNSDSSVRKQDSYVRWTNLPVKTEESLEKTGDAERAGSYESRNDTGVKNNNTLAKKTVTYYIKRNDSFDKTQQKQYLKDASDSFLHMNDSFMKKTDCYKDASDTYLNKSDSYMQVTDSYKNKADVYITDTNFSMNKAEPYMKRKDSYEVGNDYYEKRNHLFGKTRDTSITADVKGYINFLLLNFMLPYANVWQISGRTACETCT